MYPAHPTPMLLLAALLYFVIGRVHRDRPPGLWSSLRLAQIMAQSSTSALNNPSTDRRACPTHQSQIWRRGGIEVPACRARSGWCRRPPAIDLHELPLRSISSNTPIDPPPVGAERGATIVKVQLRYNRGLSGELSLMGPVGFEPTTYGL